MLAAAFARTGQMDEAKVPSEGDRLWPYFTIRGVYPEELSSPSTCSRSGDYQAALRLAGARDHADEDADFGVPPDGLLRGDITAHPTEAQGARTIRTAELAMFLADALPLVIDNGRIVGQVNFLGRIGLKFSGLGGSFADEAQDRLRRKMVELTGGNFDQPISRGRLDSERFGGCNFALRLAALGYTQRLNWYRGGREAWEVAELPEAIDLALQEWWTYKAEECCLNLGDVQALAHRRCRSRVQCGRVGSATRSRRYSRRRIVTGPWWWSMTGSTDGTGAVAAKFGRASG